MTRPTAGPVCLAALAALSLACSDAAAPDLLAPDEAAGSHVPVAAVIPEPLPVPAGGSGGQALVLNNRGQIAGSIVVPGGRRRTAIWRPDGSVVDFAAPGAVLTHPGAMNDAGQLTVHYTEPGRVGALLWEDGVETEMGAMGPGGPTIPRAMNSLGAVVGQSGPAPDVDVMRAFLWTRAGGMTGFAAPLDYRSHAFDLNDRGQVVGVYHPASGADGIPYLWESGSHVVLPSTAGATATPMFINNAGMIAGSLRTPDGRTRPAVWEDGALTDLGFPLGHASVRGLSEGGHVVWFTDDPYDPGVSRQGFIWDGATITDLGPVLSPPTVNRHGWATVNRSGPTSAVWQEGQWIELAPLGPDGGVHANAINDIGDVVGFSSVGSHTGIVPVRWVIPVPPELLLDRLADELDRLADSGVNAGLIHSLRMQLNATLALLAADATPAARGHLRAFIREVQALIRSGAIDPEDGAWLIELAERALANSH